MVEWSRSREKIKSTLEIFYKSLSSPMNTKQDLESILYSLSYRNVRGDFLHEYSILKSFQKEGIIGIFWTTNFSRGFSKKIGQRQLLYCDCLIIDTCLYCRYCTCNVLQGPGSFNIIAHLISFILNLTVLFIRIAHFSLTSQLISKMYFRSEASRFSQNVKLMLLRSPKMSCNLKLTDYSRLKVTAH